MRYTIGTIRKFKTAHFTVIVDAIEEDSPDLSWDESGETQAKINSGEYVIFCARARVIHDELGELATDYLGNCVYKSLEAFADHIRCGRYNREITAKEETERYGSYFADMVTTVCRDARKALQKAKRIKVRQA